MPSKQYVCAFRGRRDYYQIPIALAEDDLLDELITDAYFGPALRRILRSLPHRITDKLLSRFEPGLPEDRVKCLWRTTVAEHLRHGLGIAPSATFAKLDRHFSAAAAERARRTRSHLFLYNPYAWEAFTTAYRHWPKKILFQFHPHPDLERSILQADRAKYPFIRSSYEEDVREHMSAESKRRERDCWRHADVVVCASAFTRRSLMEAGIEERFCRIVPYGIDVPATLSDDSVDHVKKHIAPSEFRALFVGSGTQRKGLHHLLIAWQRAALPTGSRLTLVCRMIDPGILALAERTPNVDLVRGLTRSELAARFGRSSLFVMPSLVEGFGQVYLEALAQGCPVLGTSNTCLPDLDVNSGAIFQVQVGEIDQLVATLEELSRILPVNDKIRELARGCARRHPWHLFRKGIRNVTTE